MDMDVNPQNFDVKWQSVIMDGLEYQLINSHIHTINLKKSITNSEDYEKKSWKIL